MESFSLYQASTLFLCAAFAARAFAQEERPPQAALDTVKIERLTGIQGRMNTSENVYKIGLPRNDLAVSIAGVKLIPAMGLTSWAAFQSAGDEVMAMGDLVLPEDQVNPVLSTALANGIEVTALHNHFLWDTPKVMFTHIGGSITAIHHHMTAESPKIVFLHCWGVGTLKDLAEAIKAASDSQSESQAERTLRLWANKPPMQLTKNRFLSSFRSRVNGFTISPETTQSR